MREVFNGLRWIVRTDAQWRMMPNDLPPWHTVYQQAQRWIAAGVFKDIVHDLRALLRLAKGKKEQPSAAIFDGRTVQSTPESGERAGYDGYKRKKGSKIHIAVDTLGFLLAAHITPANEQERAQVKELAQAVQEVTQNTVEVVFVDQGYRSGSGTASQRSWHGPDCGQVARSQERLCLLPRRWAVERSFAWTTRFRRLVHDFERAPETFRSLHFVAFAILMLHNFVNSIAHVL